MGAVNQYLANSPLYLNTMNKQGIVLQTKQRQVNALNKSDNSLRSGYYEIIWVRDTVGRPVEIRVECDSLEKHIVEVPLRH